MDGCRMKKDRVREDREVTWNGERECIRENMMREGERRERGAIFLILQVFFPAFSAGIKKKQVVKGRGVYDGEGEGSKFSLHLKLAATCSQGVCVLSETGFKRPGEGESGGHGFSPLKCSY